MNFLENEFFLLAVTFGIFFLAKLLQKKTGMAIIFITHNLGVVAEICDKVAIMYAGEIIESGTTRDIFTASKHPYTEGLFGSIPRLDVETDRLRPIDGMVADPSDLPSGCSFHPRCPYCTERCKVEHPQPHVDSRGHMIQCHRFDEEGKA